MKSEINEMAKPNKILIDVKVVIEGNFQWWHYRDMENKERVLERWAEELEDFFRDHRSMDVNSVRAEREYMEVCSSCNKEWELDCDDDGNLICAYCGELLE